MSHTDLGLVLYPVRRLLELSDLPDNVTNLREERSEMFSHRLKSSGMNGLTQAI